MPKSEPDIVERVAALETELAELRQKVGATADASVLSSADLALLVDALRPLGVNAPPEGLLVAWLARWSREQILAAIERVLRLWHGHATAPGAPPVSPGADWRENAAYLESRQSHLGWSRVTYLLEHGELPADPVSMDPLESVFKGLPADASREQIAVLVPEVMRRAELGITWAGTQGTEGEELATRKAILAAGPADPRFLSEWRDFRDPRLLRVALLAGPLTRTRGMGAYPLHGIDPAWTIVEFLVVQRQFSTTWPGRPIGK